MILCKDVRLEGSTPKQLNIYGLMTSLQSVTGNFPVALPRILRTIGPTERPRSWGRRNHGDLRGHRRGLLEFGSAASDLHGADPLQFRWLFIRVKNADFPAAGAYTFEFRYNGGVLASQSLIVEAGGS